MAVGAALRLPAIADWSLYRDDAWQSLATRVDSVSEIVITGVTAPGYAVFLHAWSWAFGDSSVSLLIPSVIAGLISILATALLARKLHLSWTSAFVAGAVMAIGAVSVALSGRVKPFIADAVITVLLTWLALDTIQDRTKRKVILMALIASISFLWSASAALVAVVCIALVLATSWRKPGERAVAMWSTLGFALVSLGWYMVVLRPATTEVLHEFWESRLIHVSEGLPGAARRVAIFFAGAGPDAAGLPLLIALAGLVGAGVITMIVRRRWIHGALLVGPVAVTALLSALGLVPFGGGRTDLFLYPLVSVLAGYGLDAFAVAGIQAGRRLWPAMAVAALTVIALVASSEPADYPEESGREITRAVLDLARPTDLIVTLPETSYLWARYAPGEVGVARDEYAMTGFTPEIDDQRVLFLPGFELTSAGEANLKAREHALETMTERLDATRPARIWVVEATYFDNPFPELEQVLIDGDYAVADTVTRDFALARLYSSRGHQADS
jgi:hypothetical protein